MSTDVAIIPSPGVKLITFFSMKTQIFQLNLCKYYTVTIVR
jgi:hypothetical protein